MEGSYFIQTKPGKGCASSDGQTAIQQNGKLSEDMNSWLKIQRLAEMSPPHPTKIKFFENLHEKIVCLMIGGNPERKEPYLTLL